MRYLMWYVSVAFFGGGSAAAHLDGVPVHRAMDYVDLALVHLEKALGILRDVKGGPK